MIEINLRQRRIKGQCKASEFKQQFKEAFEGVDKSKPFFWWGSMTKPTKKGDAKNITQLNRKQGIMRNKSALNIY